MCPETAQESSCLAHQAGVGWGRRSGPLPATSGLRESGVGMLRREGASKRGFGGAQWRQCARQSCQFGRPAREIGFTLCRVPQKTRLLGIVRARPLGATGSRLPVLALGLASPKPSPRVSPRTYPVSSMMQPSQLSGHLQSPER